MKLGREFNSAYADANSPAIAFKKTAEVRQVTAASAGGGDDENIRVSFISGECPSNHEEIIRSSRAQQEVDHSSDGEHIHAHVKYGGANRFPQAEEW